ncbi:MAG: membrane protein insertase YidC [Halofilum sp. (in: g-proteobacteria)]
MQNLRLILYGMLAMLLFLAWQQWQLDYADSDPGRSPPAAESSGAASDGPPTQQADTPEAPVTAERPDADDDATSPRRDTPSTSEQELPKSERVTVVTDLFRIELDSHGGDLRKALLREHRAENESDEPVALLSDDPSQLAVAQSGLQAGDRPAPTHHDQFRVERTHYELGQGEDTLTVPLTWEGDGVRVTKEYTFRRDSYLVDVAFHVENTGAEAWVGRQYRQLQRTPIPDSRRPTLLPGFFGPAYYSEETKYEEISHEDIGDVTLPQDVQGGWVGLVDHYFLSSWVPGAEETNNFYANRLEGPSQRYLIGMYSPGREIAPGDQTSFSNQLYIGPKERDYLTGIATGLTHTIDYGYMSFLARPLFWVLDHIHTFVGNWGWAIVILTLMIKLVFYKLSETSYKSMARMKKLQPKIEQMKERYGDDREKMGRAMMDLYKTEKVNPIGGCLPILVQIPVFIALYWMLLGSVELRHADFTLWINDLSARDPYFVLPLLMGASMWIQQKLNPPPVDPIQQKIFMALPFVFTVFFAFFPAGLVVYWLTNNILSIAQQYYITRHVMDAGTPAKQSGS